MLEPKEIVKKYFAEHKAPARGLIIDIVDYPDRVGLRFYRDNFNSIPDSKQQDMVEWLRKTMQDLNNDNDFIFTIEMEAEAQ
jgi:hypothetical protein